MRGRLRSEVVVAFLGLGEHGGQHGHPVFGLVGQVLQDDAVDDGEGGAGDVVVGVVLVHVSCSHF